MRILITGGCGFLGSHLVEHFLRKTTCDIVVLDKLTYASNGFDRLRDIDAIKNSDGGLDFHKRLRVFGCDLSQPISPGLDQEIGPIDYVIHAAAESHVDRSIDDPMPFIQSNVIGTHHLLMWARSLSRSRVGTQIRRVFLVSTDEVYGPAGWDHPGHNEQHAFRPANPYAAAKAGGECLAFAYANTYRLPITIVNTMNLIGERQHPEKFVPLVIRKVLQGELVPIHSDKDCKRSGTRFYLHCRNYASALWWLMQHDGLALDPTPIKIHVAGERELSNRDLALKIAEIVGKPLMYKLVDFHSSRPGHDLRYALDDSLIRSMGWTQPVSLDDSLEKTVKWYLANPKWLGL